MTEPATFDKENIMTTHPSQTVLGFVAILGLTACVASVEDSMVEPLGGGAGGGSVVSTGTAAPSECPRGPDGCITCSEYFGHPACSAAALCDDSVPLHEAAYGCMCDQCSEECAARCSDESSPFGPDCVGCIVERCTATAEACANDSPY